MQRYLSSLVYREMVNEDIAKARKAEKINEGRLGWDELDEDAIEGRKPDW